MEFNHMCSSTYRIKRKQLKLFLKQILVVCFLPVYEEVEKRIVDLRVQLKDKLMELPSTLDEQKKLIR